MQCSYQDAKKWTCIDFLSNQLISSFDGIHEWKVRLYIPLSIHLNWANSCFVSKYLWPIRMPRKGRVLQQIWGRNLFCFLRPQIKNGVRYVRSLQVKFIDVDNYNQAKSHKWVCHIFKNIYDKCFIFNFLRQIDWEWYRGLQIMLIDIDNITQAKSQVIFSKHTWHMPHIQFFKRKRLKMVPDM